MAAPSTGVQPHGAATGSLLAACWRCRWNVLRLLCALGLLVILAADVPRAIAWIQYQRLPTVDYLAEADRLAEGELYEDALAYIDAGLKDEAYAANYRDALLAKRAQLEAERKSLLRRAKKFAAGAVSGYGTSTEGLIGAVVTDLFVVGDIRDLAIQVSHGVEGQKVDWVITGLSALGIATTVAPMVDLGAAVTKVAVKTGNLSRRLLDKLVELARLARRGNGRPLARFAGDVAVLTKRSGSGTTVLRVLRYADDPADVARMARYAEKYGSEASIVVHSLRRDAIRLLRSGDEAAETAVRLAARKGKYGRAWLRAGAWRRLARPHPVLGLLKGVWKGNVPELADRVLRGLAYPYLWLVLPALSAWCGLELLLLARRLRARQGVAAA